MTFKYVTKTIAMQEGLRATFMPKPIYGASGTGMHANISLFRGQENAFFDPQTTMDISDLARFFVGGLIEHACAITAIANPLINSYKRLVSGFEAPVYISWSGPNRSSLIRIPAGRGLSTRLEFRSPDPTCNPYLTFAVILAAGLDGIKRGIDPGEPVDLNVYHLTAEERKAWALRHCPPISRRHWTILEADKVIREALGEHVYENIMRLGLSGMGGLQHLCPSLGDREVYQQLLIGIIKAFDAHRLFLQTSQALIYIHHLPRVTSWQWSFR